MFPKKLTHKRKAANRGTKEHKAYMGKVAKLSCCLSSTWGHECGGRVTVAHKDGAGMSLKSSDYDTMPICESHHLFGPNSITYLGAKAWQRKYGAQSHWIEQARLQIEHSGL